MLFFLILESAPNPEGGNLATAGELLTLKDLEARLNSTCMDNIIAHVINAPDRTSALKIVAVLATEP